MSIFGKTVNVKRVYLLLFFLILSLTLHAHPWKPRHYVIVDTDGGADDLKALCLLLASPDVRILAVTASEGYNDEALALGLVRKMMDDLWHQGLPVLSADNSPETIDEILKRENTPVTFIALGTLRTVADALDNSALFKQKVKKIVWSNNSITRRDGFNFRTDPEAAEKVLACGIPVEVTGAGTAGFYDEAMIARLGETATPETSMILKVIESKKDHRFVYEAYDELAPLLLLYPALFKTGETTETVICLQPGNVDNMRNAAIDILAGNSVRTMQTVKSLPSDTSFYMADLQPYVTEIQKRYGEDEWTSGVIANELHRHLGVFAIIGVKMGIRAREYFATGVDELSVTSLAGSTPPLSCMNDGIQVSTGATPGHGLLNVINSSAAAPAAEFTYHNTRIRITLKKEIADKILAELKEMNFVYGLDSDIYWELVRKSSIKYWLLFDRHDIFETELIK